MRYELLANYLEPRFGRIFNHNHGGPPSQYRSGAGSSEVVNPGVRSKLHHMLSQGGSTDLALHEKRVLIAFILDW
jgi:hypothetical protein